MKKQKGTYELGGLWGIIFIAVALLAIMHFMQGSQYRIQLGSPYSGFTTLSLSAVEFTNDSKVLTGKQWVMTVAQGGLAQSASGLFHPNEIEDKSGVEPVRDFKIDITYSKQSCEYPIRRSFTAKKVQHITVRKWGCLGAPDKNVVDEKCRNKALLWGKLGQSLECFCAEATQDTGAVSRYIENPSVHTVSTIQVSNGESISSKNIDTKTNIQDFVHPNVYVVWNGYLSRDVCNSQNPYYGFYADGKWNVGDAISYDSYVNYYDSVMAQVGGGFTSSGIDAVEKEWNKRANNALVPVVFGTIDKASELDNAIIVNDMESFVSVPIFTFFVKAEYLQIKQPAPVAKINSVSCPRFSSSTEGEVIIDYSNVGDTGTITLSVECQNPFRMVGNARSFSLLSGDTRRDSVPIAADTDRTTQGTCTAKAKTIAGEVTKDITCTVDPNIVCEPNTYSCKNNAVYQCNQFGSSNELVQQCSDKEECSYDILNRGICKEKKIDDNGNGGCEWWNLPCHIGNILKGIINAIIAIGILIIAVLVLLIVFNVTKK